MPSAYAEDTGVLMLSAVGGAVAQLVGAVIKIGQAAGWWH
jgi:hypothetical protein